VHVLKLFKKGKDFLYHIIVSKGKDELKWKMNGINLTQEIRHDIVAIHVNRLI